MALEALTPEEKKRLILSIGTHRGERALSPVEVAMILHKAVEGGTSMTECAAAVQLNGTSQLIRFLSLSKLPDDIQHVIDWGRSGGTLAFTAAFELSRLDDASDQRRAVQAALEYDLTTSEVRQLVQARKRSKKSMDECVTAVLKMRPQVEVRNVFIGSVLRDDIRVRLRQLSQRQRDEILQAILERTFKDLRATGRLGSERFTLVGGAELGEAAKKRKEQLEKEINAELITGVPG
jgi:hypothetical protein